MNPIEEQIAHALRNHPNDVVAHCGIKNLLEEDMLVGKTPEGIFNHWIQRVMSNTPSEDQMAQEEREAEQQEFSLLPYSQLVWEMEQQMPGVYSFPLTLQYDATKTNTSQLNLAIAKAISNHPVFRNNEQYYDISAEDDGKTGYLNITLNRILGDGFSFGILLEDICKAYKGLKLAPDYYYRYLRQYENHKATAAYVEHKMWLENKFGSLTCPVRPTIDFPLEIDEPWIAGEYFIAIPNVSNEKVCLATAIAIMDYCHTDEAALTWAYLGRENEHEQHIFGSLHKDIPLLIHRASAREDYIQQVKDEIKQGIIHSDYPLTLTHPHTELWNFAVNVLQQPQLHDLDTSGIELLPLLPSNAKPSLAYSILDVEIESNGLTLKYSATHYKKKSIRNFAELIKQNIDRIYG